MKAPRIRVFAGLALLIFAAAAVALRLPPNADLYKGLVVLGLLTLGSALPRWDKIDASSLASLSVSSRWLIGVPLVLLIFASAGMAALFLGLGLQGALVTVVGAVLVTIFLYVLTRSQRSKS